MTICLLALDTWVTLVQNGGRDGGKSQSRQKRPWKESKKATTPGFAKSGGDPRSRKAGDPWTVVPTQERPGSSRGSWKEISIRPGVYKGGGLDARQEFSQCSREEDPKRPPVHRQERKKDLIFMARDR